MGNQFNSYSFPLVPHSEAVKAAGEARLTKG